MFNSKANYKYNNTSQLDISALRAAKNKALINNDKRDGNFDQEFNQAITLFEEFKLNPDSEILLKAAAKFNDSLRYKRDIPEPFYYLGYIFYLHKKDDLASQYLEMAESVNAEYTPVHELRRLLYR
jgi:hypothetical protein